jgi:hypothetical protein
MGQRKQPESNQNRQTNKTKIARKTIFVPPQKYGRPTDSIVHQGISCSTLEIESWKKVLSVTPTRTV